LPQVSHKGKKYRLKRKKAKIEELEKLKEHSKDLKENSDETETKVEVIIKEKSNV